VLADRGNVCRSTSQTRVSASQGTTPRTGTMSSRDLRAARAARSARSTSPAKPRSSTLKNGTQPPPLQTRSLQTFQGMSTDDLDSGDVGREARQHTLPSVSRKRSHASTESRKSAVDDFHYEYDYARQGSDKIATVTPDDAINEDFAMYRRDNLSQDSYRVSDSRDSSVDRLEMGPKLDVEAEFIGAEPLDEAKLIRKLEQEQQLQESRNMEEDNADDLGELQQNDDMLRNADERVINGEEVHVIKAEWDLPESCLQTEVEKVISIETTRIVETVETTRVAPMTDTYRRQKRLSRENAVRVVDEDMTSSPAETETCADDSSAADAPAAEFAVPVSISIDEDESEIATQEKVRSFIVSLIDDAVKKAAEEMKAAVSVEETAIGETTELNLTVTENSGSMLSASNDIESPVEAAQEQSLRDTTEESSFDETLTLANGDHRLETDNQPEESDTAELSGWTSEDTAESQITVVEMEAGDTNQETSAIDEASDEQATEVTLEEVAQRSPTDIASISQDVMETAELPNDTKTEDALSSGICPASVRPCDVADQQTEEAIAPETDTASEEIRASMNQTLSSSETERQDIEETPTAHPSGVRQETVAESEQFPDEVVEQRKDAEHQLAAGTCEDISYVLHKRHIIPAAEKTAGDTRLYATLPSRRNPSRSRSLSPSHKKSVMLTSEQKRAQLMKVKASLVSMAAEMAAQRTPRSPVGIGAPTKRVFDFVVCSRLPPRDSFSSRDDTLSPPDEHDITLVPREKKVSSTEKKPADESEAKSLQLPDIISDVEKAVCSETEPARDLTETASTSEQFQFTAGSPSIEVIAVHDKVPLCINEIAGTDTEKHTTEVEKLRTPEGLESESESDSKPVGDEAATPELEDEVNRILSDCELNVAADDNGSVASGVSGKFTDESPEVETSRDLEENSRICAAPTEGVSLPEDIASIPLSLTVTERSEAAAESHSRPLRPLSPCIIADSEHVAESLPAETEIPPPVMLSGLQALESHELSDVDQTVNGVATQSDDYQQNETDAIACGAVIDNNAAKLAAAEQRLLLELQANDHADNISSSSHSLNDQLDAEVLQSFATVPPAVDAACRLSESSVDGTATCGFGRNVHLLDWLEEQAQLRGVSVSPHGAEGHHDAAISDEDDVEHAVFEDNLQDIFAALEAEVMANPFLVPITPQTSDMCVNPVTSERLSFEDDSSLGVLEASGGVIESTCAVDAHHDEALALSDEDSKQIGAVGIAGVEGNVRHSQLSLSISSEGEVVVEHINDLSDPLEVLEIESRALPPQLRSKPVRLSSDSESLSDKCRDEENLQDVGDVLDRADESRRLSISDLDDDDHPLTSSACRVPLESDTSSDSSVGPVCVEEEADAFAALDEADNSTAGAAKARHSNSDEGDEEVHSVSSSSAVDSDPAALGNFVEQVMLHHSAGSEILDGGEETTERDIPTELVSDEQQLDRSQAAEEESARSEYTLTPSHETDVVSTVTQEALLREDMELPQGTEAFTDIAISDEDDVEQSIEDSLQDVFAALEAQVTAKQGSVPVTPLTSVVIDQESFSDDEVTPTDLVDNTARSEEETTLPAFTEAAASSGVFPGIDREETPEVTDERVSTKDTGQETVDADVDRFPSPAADVTKSSEAVVLKEHRTDSAEDDQDDVVELVRDADDSSDPALTTDRHCVQDRRDEDEALQSGTLQEIVQDRTVQPEANRKESETAQMSHESLVVFREAASGDREGVAPSEISGATEILESDSKSPEVVNVEDSASENVTAKLHSNGNDKVETSYAKTADYAVDESAVVESVENTNNEADTGCSDDRTEPGTSAELDTGVRDSAEQSAA